MQGAEAEKDIKLNFKMIYVYIRLRCKTFVLCDNDNEKLMITPAED